MRLKTSVKTHVKKVSYSMKAEIILPDFAKSIQRFDEALKIYESLEAFRRPFKDLYRCLSDAHTSNSLYRAFG